MFLFPLQIPLANIQTSKSSLLAHCHIPISQPNTQAFSVTKMKDFIFLFFPQGIAALLPEIKIGTNNGLRSQISILQVTNHYENLTA